MHVFAVNSKCACEEDSIRCISAVELPNAITSHKRPLVRDTKEKETRKETVVVVGKTC